MFVFVSTYFPSMGWCCSSGRNATTVKREDLLPRLLAAPMEGRLRERDVASTDTWRCGICICIFMSWAIMASRDAQTERSGHEQARV